MADPELDAWFDQFNFSYQTSTEGDVRDVVLPFRILVLADFGVPRNWEEGAPFTATSITARGFDESMASHGLSLEVPLDDMVEAPPLLQRSSVGSFHVGFTELADFRPDRLLHQEPTLNALSWLIDSLNQQMQGHRGQSRVPLPSLSELQSTLVGQWLGDDQGEGAVEAIPEEFDRDQLDFMITDLAAELNLAVNHLLHHREFQRIEAAWRGLHLLVTQASGDAYCQIDYASVPRHCLYEDMVFSTSLQESDFFDLLYTREYGQYGGRPYGAVIGDYSFSHHQHDIDLLNGVAGVCQLAHCLFITSISPRFFGVDGFSSLSGLGSVRELLEGRQYLKWRSFQQKPESAYVMLTLPRILLRGLWRFDDGGVNNPMAAEQTTEQGYEALWGNAAFAMGCCMLNSFKRFRMCTHLTGSDGGVVTGLPAITSTETGETVFPVEVLLSENREADLIAMGFTPLSVAKANAEVLFRAANSVRWGYFKLDGEASEAPLGAKLGAQAPYLFIVLRIAHYLRMIYRDQLGSTRTLAALRAELMSWLKRYVSDVESPAPAVRARRPLKSATLVDAEDGGDWHQMTLVVTPHIRYGGNEYSLSVDMNLDQAGQETGSAPG